MIVHQLTDDDLANRSELTTRTDVELLVRSFYRYAAMDELLGPIFSAAHVNWDAHVATLTDFWAWQLLGERDYAKRRLALADDTVAGIDWASETHVCCVIDDVGGVVERFDVAHDRSSLRAMTKRLIRAGVAGVAIERGDGPVVEVLMDVELPVFVVPSRQIKGLRSRYGSAGNKDDRFDAYVLADTLRTDGHRWTRLREDRGDTKALRALCRARRELVAMRVAELRAARQPRARLTWRHWPDQQGQQHDHADVPAALPDFGKGGVAVTGALRWLAPLGWLHGGIPADVLYARLTDAAPGLDGAESEARAVITLALVDTVEMINARITGIEERVGEMFAAHPDRVIFASLPRSGTVRAANLLAEIGDCRQKFPTDAALAALAGVSPSTRQSGKREQTVFRWGCNKKLHFAVVDFANGSRAADIYRRAIERGCRHNHAVRILARAWIRIIWRCWQDSVAFDPTLHAGRQPIAA